MAKLRLTFFGSRLSSKPDQSRSGDSVAPKNKQQSRFQLLTGQKDQSPVEWEVGDDENKLFQLKKNINAPTNGLLLKQRGTSTSKSFVDRSSNMERWRRPTPETIEPNTADDGAPTIPTNSAIEGEILPSSPWARPDGANSPTAAEQSAYHSPAARDKNYTGTNNAGTNHTGSNRSARDGRHSPSAIRSPLLKPFTGEEGVRRVLATRIALDEALDRWWTNGEHAPLSLLRDGLLALEAGHELDETQRSFLLRTALRTGRGIVTALQYQIDTDRTAFLFKEALLDAKHPFDPTLINQLRQVDDESEEWADYLEHDLAYEATVASGKRCELAATALQTMQSQWPIVEQAAEPVSVPNPLVTKHLSPSRGHSAPLFAASKLPNWPNLRFGEIGEQLRPLSHRWSLRWLLWAALMLFVPLRLGWPQLLSSAPMVEIPAGTYMISDPASSAPAGSGRFRTVTLSAYAIDQHEVTNSAYRHCWEQGACPIPSSFDSQSRPGYFVDRAFNDFPVVNIDWEAANTYCSWVGKRLPTLEEWEVAASLAPTTGLRYAYPWGERFEARVVNGALSQIGDTQAVGTYHSAGSTPLGLMDMAGNVAEWTSMPASSMIDGIVVKGGSFQDQPEQLRNDALLELDRATSAPWLGLRCAVDK